MDKKPQKKEKKTPAPLVKTAMPVVETIAAKSDKPTSDLSAAKGKARAAYLGKTLKIKGDGSRIREGRVLEIDAIKAAKSGLPPHIWLRVLFTDIQQDFWTSVKSVL